MGLFSGGGGDLALERRVAELERQLRELQIRLAVIEGGVPVNDAGGPGAPAAPRSAHEPDPQVLALVGQGRKIEAIKRVRALNGWGLKESKDYVDRLDGSRGGY